jgi:hypothetical protein
MVVATPTDLSDKYRISDPVDQLRVWGLSIVYQLPDVLSPQQRYIIGSAEDALIRIQDSKGRISRQHGELGIDEYGWRLTDLRARECPS